ncbi:MAG: hypothetical protein HKN49_09920 [Gammaproteobacteria bacterium]|nr:hypothetical protein [Gammaproteobacteria bacterium]
MGISQMLSGTRAEAAAPEEQTEQERLLNLFWNRAELKKEFSNLRHDRDHLIEKLKEQEKRTDKVRKQLRDLEVLLSDPAAGYRAIVYYQLRALWHTCHKQIGKFSEELKKQQQDRERKRQIMVFNQERQKRLKEVSGRIVSVKAEADEMNAVLEGYKAQMAKLRGFWNFFKRRDLQQTIDQHKERLDTVRARIEELFDRRIKIESEQWPDYAGLGVPGKRAINLAMIAFTQHLYVYLSESSVAAHARGAKLKKVDEVNYGAQADCEYMMKKIKELREALIADRNYGDELKARTEMLSKQVEYRNEKDTVPDVATISKLVPAIPGFDAGRTHASMPMDVNVIADDYWDVSKILLK